MMPKVYDLDLASGRHVGLRFDCPDCSSRQGALPPDWRSLRVETAADWPPGECPDNVGQVGGLAFVLRCDICGCRVEMKGSRLPTVQMLKEEGAHG